MEQLIAESTGKEGKGIIPVDREPLAARETTAAIECSRTCDWTTAQTVRRMPQWTRWRPRAFPWCAWNYRTPISRAEFFRWEFATAVAGAILGINPFDQSDVEFSKIETKKLTTA